MSTPVIGRQGIPILGKEDRAEKLIQWSSKLPVGKRHIKDLSFGLRLGFMSNGLEPKVYIYWNPVKFRDWLKSLGQIPERLCLVEYGISLMLYKGRTTIYLLGAGKTGKMMWDTNNPFCREQSLPSEKSQVNWLLGMVTFKEGGPEFFDVPEAQEEVEQAGALAIITNSHKNKQEKASKPGQVLKKAKISDEAKQFLIKDILLNQVLANAKSKT